MGYGGVAERGVQGRSCQRCHEVGHSKSGLDHGAFARDEEGASNSAACPRGMDVEGAYTCSVPLWIEPSIFTLPSMIASIECPSPAPTAATDHRPVALHNEVGSVTNELPVDREDGSQGCLDLALGIIGGLECANRHRNERLECGHIHLTRQPQGPRHGRWIAGWGSHGYLCSAGAMTGIVGGRAHKRDTRQRLDRTYSKYLRNSGGSRWEQEVPNAQAGPGRPRLTVLWSFNPSAWMTPTKGESRHE